MSDYIIIDGELYHHGIKGQRWGVRRYQNEDGSLTDAGKKRYGAPDVQDRSTAKRMFRTDKKNAEEESLKLRYAKGEIDSIDSKLAKTTNANKRAELTDRKNLLSEYTEQQRIANDFAIQKAEKTRKLLMDKYGAKVHEIPMDVVGNGERLVQYKLPTWAGALGPLIKGTMDISRAKNDIADYEYLKRNGRNTNTNWSRLYKEYGLKYPGR